MQIEMKIEDIAFGDVFKQAKQYNATDIYILEDKFPRIGRLKEYIPYPEAGESKRQEILRLIEQTHPDRVCPVNGNSGQQAVKADYAFAITDYGRYRVSVTTSEEGVGMSIRKLPFYIPELDIIDKFRFFRGIRESLKGKISHGLILHTGTTGSGKSTIIASEVDMLARNIAGNILTFEDPIEYRFTPSKALIRQYEVGRHVDSFMDGVKSALRNNPVAIVVGEVRSTDEIRALVDVAMRGHLVFSTLHTANVMNTVRFLDSVSEHETWKQMLAYSIKAIVSQKLIYRADHGFILIPEIFIPNDVARNKIARGEFKDLKDLFYGNSLRETGSYTFEDSFRVLQGQGIISDIDRKTLFDGGV